jgi:hypothetical protein
MLVYTSPDDVLTVLAGNLDEISKAVTADVTVDLSPVGAEIVSEADLGANREQDT